jgi:hypothetical protein
MGGVKSPLFLTYVLALATGVCQTDPVAFAQNHAAAAPQSAMIVPAPTDPHEPTGLQEKAVPAPGTVPFNSPLAIDEATSSARSIRVLSEEQMSASDRDLAADAESSIRERAEYESLDVDASGWTYHQLDCPALPNHLFLRFTRNDGTREMSMLSAAIPRNGNGRVNIIPIVRKGYSLFSPAPISAITIAAFNRIRTEEGLAASRDWLGTGLCYAALAGANPNAVTLHFDTDETGELPATIPPTLLVGTDGGAVIRFVDISTEHPIEWSMTFDGKGKLVKTSHKPIHLTGYRKLVPGYRELVPMVNANQGTHAEPHQ